MWDINFHYLSSLDPIHIYVGIYIENKYPQMAKKIKKKIKKNFN